MGSWVRPDIITAGQHQRFMTLSGERAVLRINSAGRLHFYVKIDGTLKGITANVMKASELQHVAGTYDGQTLRLYHNGLEVASLAAVGSIPSGNTLNINGSGESFAGQMDEIVIFDRTLSAAEIKGLAQTPDWQPTTLEQSGALLSNWSYTLDGEREGFYELWLRGSDSSGNTETGGVAWRGVIDTVAPQIEVTATHTGEGATAETLCAFTINDFAIDMNSLSYDCCDSADLVTLAYEEPERLLDGVLYQITASCTVPGHETGTVNVTACDGVGLCTTALDFDGVDDYVQIPNESAFDLNIISVAFWVKVDAFTTNWQAMVTKGDSAWRVHRCNGGSNISFGTTGLSNGDLCSNTAVNDGQWHHVVAIYDGSAKYLYIDGQLDNSIAVTGAILTNDYDVLIGNNAQKTSRFFNGQIDDVRIYSSALSGTDVATLYGEGSNAFSKSGEQSQSRVVGATFGSNSKVTDSLLLGTVLVGLLTAVGAVIYGRYKGK